MFTKIKSLMRVLLINFFLLPEKLIEIALADDISRRPGGVLGIVFN